MDQKKDSYQSLISLIFHHFREHNIKNIYEKHALFLRYKDKKWFHYQ